ncbi:MAG: glycoside hydrolase domain-containing protein, partial [Planctomycetota bacterium]
PNPDRGWRGDWEVANELHQDEGVWVKELRVPMADLGLKPDEVMGRDFGILVARNIKRGRGWLQCPWFPHSHAFVNVDGYPRIQLREDPPTVSLDSFGGLDLHEGPLKLDARVFNPGPAREVKVDLRIESTTMPEIEETKTLELPADGVAEYSHHVSEGRLHTDAKHTLHMEVTSPDGQETYFNYRTNWTQAPEDRWPKVETGPQPEKALDHAYYPSYDRLRLELNPLWLELDRENYLAEYEVVSERGQVLKSGEVHLEADPDRQAAEVDPEVVELDLPDLLDGEYTVRVDFEGWDEPVEQTFERKHYPWEGNEIGVTDEVLPPFEPVRVDDNEVNVVLRSYSLDDLGFWNSIRAEGNVSAGGPEELLAEPMRVRVNDGEALEGDGGFVEKERQRAVYEGHADHPGVTLNTTATTEVDGVTKFELELAPGTQEEEIEALWVDIPLRDELMPLYHVSMTSLRYNPAGQTPDGEGVIWDTRDLSDGSYYGNFLPYIYLGAEERGLAWFADNDKGWVLNVDEEDPEESTPCVELIRRDGVLTMRVNLVQRPIKLEEPREIVFGLMAAPAKPMPEDWRTGPIHWMGAQYWGSDRSFGARYPRNKDLSPLDMMEEYRFGRGDEFDYDTFIEEWTERNFGEDKPAVDKDKDQMRSLLGVSRGRARDTAGEPFTVYWEEFHTVDRLNHPEPHIFKHEWGGGSPGNIQIIHPSYQDFATWWGAEFVRRGIGLYFDNSFPNDVYDTLASAAYVLPNGEIQPSAGIWNRRDYLRRIWTLHEQWGPEAAPPYMMIHMTNTHILPYMVWNHSNLDMEWFYSDSPVQKSYDTDMLRVQSIGRQSGNIPAALAMGDKTKGNRPGREEMGAIFEIRLTNNYRPPDYFMEFGYGTEDTEVFNFWDEGYPITFSDPRIKSILLRRGDEARLLLATWNGNDSEVRMTIDSDALGFDVSEIEDVRAEETLELNQDGSVEFSLEGYGTMLLDLR